nr:pulmonary surfactant-associated protein D-like [Cherax quadricarinatus]
MKFVLLLSVVGLATCQFNFGRRQFFRGQRPRQGGFNRFPQQQGGAQADDVRGGSAYYYSWRHDGGRKYTGNAAASLCASLGGGWQAVGISSNEELNYINSVVGQARLEYIWTGGVKSGNGWRWLNGEPFRVTGWSHTGGAQRPQPDNREGGRENCLAVLNNFYGDGIKWHDVACHHEKAVICERRA